MLGYRSTEQLFQNAINKLAIITAISASTIIGLIYLFSADDWRKIDKISISKVLAQKDVYPLSLISTIICGMLLWILSLSRVFQQYVKFQNMENEQEHKEWKFWRIALCISGISSTFSWITSICGVMWNCIDYPIIHMIFAILVVIFCAFYQGLHSYLTIRQRLFEFKLSDKHKSKLFNLFDGLSFSVLYIAFIIEMIVYGWKYYNDIDSITNPNKALNSGYIHEWLGFSFILAYFFVMAYTLYRDPIQGDILVYFKRGYWKFWKCGNIENIHNHSIKHKQTSCLLIKIDESKSQININDVIMDDNDNDNNKYITTETLEIAILYMIHCIKAITNSLIYRQSIDIHILKNGRNAYQKLCRSIKDTLVINKDVVNNCYPHQCLLDILSNKEIIDGVPMIKTYYNGKTNKITSSIDANNDTKIMEDISMELNNWREQIILFRAMMNKKMAQNDDLSSQQSVVSTSNTSSNGLNTLSTSSTATTNGTSLSSNSDEGLSDAATLYEHISVGKSESHLT